MGSSAAGRKNPLTNAKNTVSSLTAPSFWTSVTGRNVVGMSGAVAAGVYFGGYTVLHTWFLDRYQNVVQLYKHGFPTPLAPVVAVRCQETVNEMNVKLKNQEMVRFFCVFGMDMFYAGSTKFRGGSIIGVPRCFAYETVNDIEKNDIVVENKIVEWGSDGGQMLQDSLILSERAQKFAIAREICMVDTHAPYVHGSIGAFSMLTYGLTTRFLNDKLYGHMRPKSFRLMMYSLVATFSYGVYATVTDLVTKYYENSADSMAGRINLNYARGGVEYYSKILERNMALRSLMGPNGEKRFTFYGNDVEYIRQKHVPYSTRKINLENIASQLAGIHDDPVAS